MEDELSQNSETESMSTLRRGEYGDPKTVYSTTDSDNYRNHSVSSLQSVAIEVEPLSQQLQIGMPVAPPLSEGKKYHVFFSYEITDRKWVEQITNKLESPDFGFKCSVHERDFHGGKRIIENITEHIRLSEKTVLVLSPDFLQSHWCMFEIEMGMILGMEESQLLVVPVMVKQCPVPDSIKTLTYIDATPGNDWWQRFIGAIVSRDDLLSNYTGTRDVTVRPRYGNMEKLTEIVSSYKCPSGEVIRAPYVPEALLRPGIQIPPEEFDKSFDLIRSVTCFCKHLYDFGPCCVPILVLLLFTGFVAMPVLTIILLSRIPFHPHVPIITTAFTLPWMAFTAGFFIQRLMRKRRMRKALTEANTIFLKYNIIVGFNMQMSGCVTSRTFLEFWFYNPTDCKNSLAAFLEGKHVGMNAHASQVYASQLIHHHSVGYTSAYQEGQLKVKHGVRHVRNAACLCQYIEEKYCEGRIAPLDVV
ncbi:uncharacterized protein LOC124275904 [Haliotis rubra]|uniref:uncharacterized protein LOC124275904 n=1 Tax=Haliotis rubra TaxID=36100 RepID=UPI001EE58F8F|nr:uncharacterized protein LOC124275904 [Haliotis rubra]XP_046567544.1 uncharacterized protein LOC124275904 [Haliotis rubra]